MILAGDILRDAEKGVSVTDAPEGLSAIGRPDCAAAIWRRDPSPGFLSWIDGLAPQQLPSARVILKPSEVRDVVRQICEASGTPDCAERTQLIDDAAALADRFAALVRGPYLRLRFDIITTNACRKFHIDAVTARLICTYRGTGTQYGCSAGGAEPSRYFTVPTGAPIILRGTLWPERPKSGLLHRSPPIDGTDETRLIFVLDPVLDPEEEV